MSFPTLNKVITQITDHVVENFRERKANDLVRECDQLRADFRKIVEDLLNPQDPAPPPLPPQRSTLPDPVAVRAAAQNPTPLTTTIQRSSGASTSGSSESRLIDLTRSASRSISLRSSSNHVVRSSGGSDGSNSERPVVDHEAAARSDVDYRQNLAPVNPRAPEIRQFVEDVERLREYSAAGPSSSSAFQAVPSTSSTLTSSTSRRQDVAIPTATTSRITRSANSAGLSARANPGPSGSSSSSVVLRPVPGPSVTLRQQPQREEPLVAFEPFPSDSESEPDDEEQEEEGFHLVAQKRTTDPVRIKAVEDALEDKIQVKQEKIDEEIRDNPNPRPDPSLEGIRMRVLKLACFEPGCAYTFSTKPELDDHLRSKAHRKSPFRCWQANCGISFTTKHKLGKHIKHDHARDRVWRCTYFRSCNKSYKDAKSLHMHVHSYHYKGLFQCTVPTCRRIFGLRGKLNAHYYRAHEC